MVVQYRDEVDEISKCFEGYKVKYVKREENEVAHLLSKVGSARKPIPPSVFLEHLRTPSMKGADRKNPDIVDSFVNVETIVPPAWTKPFMDYLRKNFAHRRNQKSENSTSSK